MKMRILCLIDTLGFGGGAERQMAGLAGLLTRQGLDVKLATYHKHDYDNELQRIYGIQSTILPAGETFWSKFMAVRRYIKKEKFDVVIAYKDGATMIACLSKILFGKFKLVVSERNTNVDSALSKREKLKFFLYRWANRIVPNSYAQAEFIGKRFPHLSSKTCVITNFTDIQIFSPAGNPQSGSEFVRVLTTARIAPQKNVLRFMHVIRRLKDNNIPVRFDWFGSTYTGMEAYSDIVRKEYETLDIADYLTFHEATKNIADEYRKCDIFCLPSVAEGYPNVVCEAMSCAKPILCSRICDNPHIVEEGRSGLLFDPTDEEDMYRKIISLSQTAPSERVRMGLENREIALCKFSEEAFANSYITLINSLV